MHRKYRHIPQYDMAISGELLKEKNKQLGTNSTKLKPVIWMESKKIWKDDVTNKGVAGLIKIKNPNRVIKIPVNLSKILSYDQPIPKTEISGGDQRQLRKQEARLRYEKLHAKGKTAQAKADLARLAIIRQQRAEAAAKRHAEIKKKSEDKKKPNDSSSIPKTEISGGDQRQLRKQEASRRYEKLHAKGKTAQAKADLARLAIIRRQRAEAGAKWHAEIKKKSEDEKKPNEES